MNDPGLNGTQPAPEDYISQPVQNSEDPSELQTLLGAHLSLIGERLQDISRNIYTVSLAKMSDGLEKVNNKG